MPENLSTKLPRVLLGGFVADAASMGTHWIYNPEKLRETFGEEGISHPEFHEPPACPFYSSKVFPGHYESGQLSPYGEEALGFLEYLASAKGNLNGEDFASFFYEWTQKHSAYMNRATKLFIANVKALKDSKKSLYPDCGADDHQPEATFKVPQIALGYLGTPEFLPKVEEIIRAHQNNDEAVNFGIAFAKLLETILTEKLSFGRVIETVAATLPKDVRDATEKGWLERVRAEKIGEWDQGLVDFLRDLSHELYDKYNPGKEKTEFRNFYALSCPFPQSYIVALKVISDTVETFGSPAEFKNKGFEFGVRRNSLSGGDNCGRSFIVGSLLAALGAQVPESWVLMLKDAEKIKTLAQTVLETSRQ